MASRVSLIKDIKQFLKDPYIATSIFAIAYLQFSSIVLDYFPRKLCVFEIWFAISLILMAVYWYLRRKAYFDSHYLKGKRNANK
jgi:hypothetical protein